MRRDTNLWQRSMPRSEAAKSLNIALGLSQRRHLPVLKFMGGTYAVWSLPALLRQRYRFHVSDEPGRLRFARGGWTLALDEVYAKTLVMEWGKWERYYLPQFPLRNKTVLLVGAGQGESAAFYASHGATRFICVESDDYLEGSADILRANMEGNHWDAVIYKERFALKHLSEMPFDFAEIDCEGGERELLKLDKIGFPCVVEYHGADTGDELVRKFGMERVDEKSVRVVNGREVGLLRATPGPGHDGRPPAQ